MRLAAFLRDCKPDLPRAVWIIQLGNVVNFFGFGLVLPFELILGDDIHHLRQGDAIRFPTAAPHAFRNASTSGMAVVVGAATPPW